MSEKETFLKEVVILLTSALCTAIVCGLLVYDPHTIKGDKAMVYCSDDKSYLINKNDVTYSDTRVTFKYKGRTVTCINYIVEEK